MSVGDWNMHTYEKIDMPFTIHDATKIAMTRTLGVDGGIIELNLDGTIRIDTAKMLIISDTGDKQERMEQIHDKFIQEYGADFNGIVSDTVVFGSIQQTVTYNGAEQTLEFGEAVTIEEKPDYMKAIREACGR